MIPINESGKQKGKINQTILQTGNAKGFFKFGDPHPKKEFDGCFFIQTRPINSQRPNPERWGDIGTVTKLLKEKKKQSEKRKSETKKKNSYGGLNKGCLPQKLLQVNGNFIVGDKHPNNPDLVLIKIRNGRSAPQQWGTKKQLEEKIQKGRDYAESKRREEGIDPFSTRQTDYSRTFKRLDKHPTIKGLFFLAYYYDKRSERSVEDWRTKEQIEHRREGQLSHNLSKERKKNKKEGDRKWRNQNKVKLLVSKKEYYDSVKNTDKYKRERRNYQRSRLKEDECYRIRQTYSSRVRIAIKKQRGDKAYRTLELLGTTIENTREHLESQFTQGMKWDNMGRGGWHIDHIIPCSFFDLTKPSHQKVCFNWQNLQPLWEKNNITKGNKFPPSVLLVLFKYGYNRITV